METIRVQTPTGSALVDITQQVQAAVQRAGVLEGICVLFVPHTTAAVTLNENWDPDVRSDILLSVGGLVPDNPRHRHSEGNSPAHIKASLFGNSQTLIVEGGQLQLGHWQGVYLAEFDGPRSRSLMVKIVEG